MYLGFTKDDPRRTQSIFVVNENSPFRLRRTESIFCEGEFPFFPILV